ncbi:MAG: ABC transporter permease [Nanoarchaeota archaeon]
MKKIYYVWLRELKRFIRSKSRVVGSLGLPLLFLVALGFGLNDYMLIQGENYLQFLIPGIVSMAVLMNSMMSGVSVIWDKQFGFMREMLVTPVGRAELIIGKTLGGATTALSQGILIFIISLFIGLDFPGLIGLLIAIVFMIMVGIAFSALGLCFASFIEDMEAFPLIMNFVILPLFFLSGALFPITGENIPKFLSIAAHSDPLTYGVDAIRFGLTGVSAIPLWIDFIVMAVACLVFVTLGTYLFSKIQM